MANSYEVTRRDGVTIITGSIPINECVALMNNASEEMGSDGIADSLLAAHLNAALVWGAEKDCLALRKKLNIK